MDWDVPFKPHAALWFTVHKGWVSLPVPQAPRFTLEPGEYQDKCQSSPIDCVLGLFETPTTISPDVDWGRVMEQIETQLGMERPGRGWCFPVKREPLIAPSSSQRPWKSRVLGENAALAAATAAKAA